MMVQIQERDAELRGIAIGEKRGQERGIAIGEKRGIAIGEKRGEKRGEQNASLRIAKQLLLNHLPIDAIANACDLTIEQVLAIKAQLATD